MSAAAVLITTTGDAIVAFEFCHSAVDDVKARIPVHARAWNPARKVWTISAGPFVPVVVDILEDIFGYVDVTDERGGYGTAGPAPPLDAYAVLHLRPTAPPELVSAAYKCLAKLRHPDRGGNTATMQAINQAVSIIQERQTS